MTIRIWTSAACAAALIAAVPALAEGPASAGRAVQTLMAASSVPVGQFYDSRANTRLWFRDGTGAAADQLAAILRRAPLDGLDSGPELAAAVESASYHAATGDPAAIAEAEQLMSAAWVAYVQAIRWPATGMLYGHRAMSPQIPQADRILDELAAAPSIEQHLHAVSRINPVYAQLRGAAWRVSAASPQLLANLQRAKALPASGRYVLVNIAEQRLWMMEDGRPQDSMRVIVGKPDEQTPMIASLITHATFNPYWNVPTDLARKNIAPNVLKSGDAFLQAKGYEVLSGWTDQASVVSSDSVDWAAVADGRTEVRIRQRPGAGNMMGQFKFGFANDRGIYLHDTPDKALFAESSRMFSSGCVRLEDAGRLARWLFGHEPAAPSSDPEQEVALPEPVPVYLIYLTLSPGGGELAAIADVYGLDSGGLSRIAAR